MKLVSIQHEGAARLGVVVDNEALVLPSSMGDMLTVIEAGDEGLGAIRSLLDDRTLVRRALDEVHILPPLSRFRRDILCTGWNYHAHFDEGVGKRGDQEVERPKAPTFFTKGPDTVIGARDPIAFDTRLSECWDYEGEIAVIIGRPLFSPSVEESEAAIFGYCLANDISQRDLQRRHGGQWLKGKSVDGTMPMGPFIVTADEVDLANVTLECFVNCERRQSAAATQMAFSVGELISELAFGMTLKAGDVVLTGTPAGIGSARVPPSYLRAGDEIVVRATGLGELRNVVEPTDLARNSPVVRALN